MTFRVMVSTEGAWPLLRTLDQSEVPLVNTVPWLTKYPIVAAKFPVPGPAAGKSCHPVRSPMPRITNPSGVESSWVGSMAPP